jgi:hypothetical protein
MSRTLPLELDPIMEVATKDLDERVMRYDIVALRHWIYQRIYLAKHKYNKRSVSEGTIIKTWLYEFEIAYRIRTQDNEILG